MLDHWDVICWMCFVFFLFQPKRTLQKTNRQNYQFDAHNKHKKKFLHILGCICAWFKTESGGKLFLTSWKKPVLKNIENNKSISKWFDFLEQSPIRIYCTPCNKFLWKCLLFAHLFWNKTRKNITRFSKRKNKTQNRQYLTIYASLEI